MEVISLAEQRRLRVEFESIRAQLANSRGFVMCSLDQHGAVHVQLGGLYLQDKRLAVQAVLRATLDMSEDGTLPLTPRGPKGKIRRLS